MKLPPIVVLAVQAILLFRVLGQTVQAQSTITNESGVAFLNGAGAYSLTVDYMVLYTSGNGPAYYTYDYTVLNPGASDTTLLNFSVAFNATAEGVDGPAVPASNPISGGNPNGQNNGTQGISWQLDTAPGANTGTLSFESDYAPIGSTAAATGHPNPSGGWQGGEVAVPNAGTVSEPATTTLLVLALLRPAFRPRLLKKA